MTLERFRTDAPGYRRTSLVDVPSGALLAELRIPVHRRGWVVVAHDGAHDPSFAVEDLHRNGLATLCVRLDGAANAMRLVETVAWLKRSVAEAQGLPVGLLGFGAAASAALSAAAVLGKQLGALVAVNASPDLAKARLNGVNTFSLLIADQEHAGVNRRALQRVRGVARLEIADGSLEEAARVYGGAWLSGHVGAIGAQAPARGMLSRLVDSWRMPKLWFGAPSRAAAAFLLAAGAYFVAAPDAQAAVASSVDVNGVLTVTGNGTDTIINIQDSAGFVLVNGANPDSPGGQVLASSITAIHINGGSASEFISVATLVAANFTNLDEVIIDGGGGNDTIIGNSALDESISGGTGADSISAGGGNDTLVAQNGEADTLFGGDGDDLFVLQGNSSTGPLDGGANNDTLRIEGTAGNDDLQVTMSSVSGLERVEIDGQGGNDIIDFRTYINVAGDVSISGGDGNDTIGCYAAVSGTTLVMDGGAGDDSLVGPGTGSWTAISLLGSDGNDTLAAGGFSPSLSVLNGGLGDDSMIGGFGSDLLLDEGSGSTTADGGFGADTLTITGDSLDNAIDVLVSNVEFSTINAGDGRDTIGLDVDVSATTLQMLVNGEDGNDSLFVDTVLGANFLLTQDGGAGNDTVSGSALGDTIVGGDGDDSLLGNDGNDRISGDVPFSSVAGNDILIGGEGNDTLIGDNDSLVGGDDLLDGGNGDDSIEGNLGNDEILGGDGNDTLMGNEAREDGSESTTLDADTIDGGIGNDSIFGGFRNDFLDGGDGDDFLAGGRDNDTVLGGPGNDTITEVDSVSSGDDSLVGGTGNDQFLMKPGSEDTVADSGGTDTLNFAAATLGVRMNLDKKGVRQNIDDNDNGLTLFGVFEGWVGSALDDELDLSPLVASRTVDGGTHTGGDLLTYDQKGFGAIDTAGTLTPTVGGFGVVNYANFETVVLADSFDSNDIDGDSIPNSLDLDNDNDGIPDAKDPDKDGDGWDDDVEIDAGTDPLDPTDFPDDSIVGTSGTDTDNDGIPDEIEDVVGDLDPSTSPGQMSVSKFTGKLKFPSVLKDALAFKTRLALPAGFALDGAHLIVDIGGVIKEFDLDSKGKSDRTNRDNKAKLKLLPVKKQILAGAVLADLQVNLKKQDFATELGDEGMDGTASDTPTEHQVMLFVIADGTPYKAVKKVVYKNKKGSSGAFKNAKPLKELP